MPRLHRLLPLLLLPSVLHAAYPIAPLVTSATTPGVNYSAYRMAINNDASYALVAFPNYTSQVLLNGQSLLPPDLSLGNNAIIQVSISNAAHVASMVYVPGVFPPEVIGSSYTIYFDQTPVVKPGSPSLSTTFPAGSFWSAIYSAVINDQNDVYITGSMYIPTRNDSTQVLARFSLSPAGAVLQEQTLFQDFDRLPDGATTSQAANPSRDHWGWEVNNAGQVLSTFTLFPNGGGSAQTLYRDHTQLIRSGSPSPISGSTYSYVHAAHLNNLGDWAAITGLNGSATDSLVVANGQKIVALGDILPNGFSLTSLVEQVLIGDDGAVFWAGTWNDPDTTKNVGIFRNNELLLQQGAASLNGSLLTNIDRWGVGGTFTVSDDGSKLAFHGTLANGTTGLFLLTLPEPSSLALLSIPALLLLRRTQQARTYPPRPA